MIEHFYNALTKPYGLALATDNPQLLVQKLHAARREAKDERLKALIVSISRDKPDSEVWISHHPEPEANAKET